MRRWKLRVWKELAGWRWFDETCECGGKVKTRTLKNEAVKKLRA
jgi:hypothetical protein